MSDKPNSKSPTLPNKFLQPDFYNYLYSGETSSMSEEDIQDALDALKDPTIRAAVIENDFRYWLSGKIKSACKQEKIEIRDLAERAGIPKSQVKRLLHKEVGGDLTFRSIVRILLALNLKMSIRIEEL